MSDDGSATPMPHPTTGGKTLQSLERPRYKSWRKKYRKMRHTFDAVLEENRRMFKEEQKLESVTRRLREELDGILEICLELNNSAAISPAVRYDVSAQDPSMEVTETIPPDFTPEQAMDLWQKYNRAVQMKELPADTLPVARQMMNDRLAAQGVRSLDAMQADVSRMQGMLSAEKLGEFDAGTPRTYLTYEQEADYLSRLDARLGVSLGQIPANPQNETPDNRYWSELTPREQERQAELANPQSQHSWLKNHVKPATAVDVDDTESLASHDNGSKATRKKSGGKNLFKHAMERTRELSPWDSEKDLERQALASKKKGRDPDGTYRIKGGHSGGKAKRKRSGEDVTWSGKKLKTKVEAEAE